MSRKYASARSALTLAECLVVVTIVTVLIAILLPSLSSARRTAQRAQCLSNLRQLQYAFLGYANSNAGRPFASLSDGAKDFWAPSLIPYSSKVDVNAKLLLSAMCPNATTLSKGIGTAAAAWGPSASLLTSDTDKLVVNAQYGGYGLNGWLYWVNPSSRTPAFGVMCSSADISSSSNVSGNLLCVTTAKLSGSANVTPSLVAATLTNSSSGFTGTYLPYSGQQLPDVTAIYNSLLPDAYSVSGTPTTLDFTAHPIIKVGTVNFSSAPTVIGSGTLISSGNVTFSGGSAGANLAFNVVALGSFTTSGGGATLNGSVYCVGTLTLSGGSVLKGVAVTNGQFKDSGGSVLAAPAPYFDPFSTRSGYVNSLIASPPQLPVFGDCIWAEAWPAIGEAPVADTSKGDITKQLGRFTINRHNSAINVVFLDGHAETVPLAGLPKLQWSPQFAQ